MNKYIQPCFEKSALITIDTQNDFTLPGAPALISGTEEIVPNMNRLLSVYREKNLPIIHVIRLYLRDGSNVELCRKEAIEKGVSIVVSETDGAELVQAIKPSRSVKLDPSVLLSGGFQRIGENEHVMYKPRWGAFFRTPLERFLRDHRRDTLVFSGCNFPNCPRTSVYEASERDFRVVLVKDAVSQLYPKGEEEMKNIGVSLLATNEIEEHLA